MVMATSMHILFLTDNFPPEVNAPASRTYEHCQEWIKLGAEVTVITCVPNFPQGKIYEGYRNRPVQKEMMDGIRVIRVWSYIAANAGFGLRVVDYFSFAASSMIAGLFQKPDIIVATSPQFFTTFAGFALSKLKRQPWVFELRDLWPDSIKTVGAMREGVALKLLEKVERFLYRDAAKVVALTDAFKRNLVARGIRADKIEVVTNGSNLDQFTPREKDEKLVEQLKLKGKFVVGYIGTHGMAHSLEFIVECLDKIHDPDIHFLFIGDGARKKAAVGLAREKNLKNVTFLEPVPKEAVPDYMSVTDVALVPLLKSETFKTVIPSKIFEASAMRKPILLGVEGQAREIVEQYDAGICFEPENEKNFLATVIKLKEDRALYERMQEGCTRLAQDYDRKKLAKKMYECLKETASSY